MSQLYEIQPAASSELAKHRLSHLPILLLNVHTLCNCRCVMCDIWKRSEGRELPVADLERHRASMISLGVRNVVLSGGEPLFTATFRVYAISSTSWASALPFLLPACFFTREPLWSPET